MHSLDMCTTGSVSFNAKAHDSVVFDVKRRFTEFVRLTGDIYDVHLPEPRLPDELHPLLMVLKEFCGGFLESPRSHLWHSPTSHLSRKTRMSISMSLFLHRKALPSESPDLSLYQDKMRKAQPGPDPAFLSFVRREVARMFPAGWDYKYSRFVNCSSYPTSSCRENRRGSGGCRMAALNGVGEDGLTDRESFCKYVLESVVPRNHAPCKLLSVETGGKHRIVSSNAVHMNVLRPLHRTMYEHISRRKWCLVGDAKPSQFSEFVRVPGQVFVSGDYESATDNLSIDVQRAILAGVLDSCSRVPRGICFEALASQVMDMEGPLGVTEQARGQLMGNLLSFPLLCIVNYLAFRFVCGTKYPVRINGDDIVFRAPRDVADKWMNQVERAGLTLSRGKTFVDPVYFTLNSRMFQAGFQKVRTTPVIRSTAYFGTTGEGGVDSLRGRYYSAFESFSQRRREKLRTSFLKWNKKLIGASHRSLSRGLGIRVSTTNLVDSNLYQRELWYLSLPREKPLPPRACWWSWNGYLKDYCFESTGRLTKDFRKRQKEGAEVMLQYAWKKPDPWGAERLPKYGQLVRKTGYNWGYWFERRLKVSRQSKLLGLSKRNGQRYLKQRLTPVLARRMELFREHKHTALVRRSDPEPVPPQSDTCKSIPLHLDVDRGDYAIGELASVVPKGPNTVSSGVAPPDSRITWRLRFAPFVEEEFSVHSSPDVFEHCLGVDGNEESDEKKDSVASGDKAVISARAQRVRREVRFVAGGIL